jgi:hypothetical protein
LILDLIVFVLGPKLEPFQANYQNRRQFPDVNLLNSRLMLLASVTVPLVLTIKILSFAVLSQALLQAKRSLTLGTMCDRYT